MSRSAQRVGPIRVGGASPSAEPAAVDPGDAARAADGAARDAVVAAARGGAAAPG